MTEYLKSAYDKSSLSVAVITQNEAENLPDCLKSVAFAKQVVVVDSGSTDDTVETARGFGCEVFLRPWTGNFGEQKQFALDRCTQPWILVLDADERIPPETASIIRNITNNKVTTAAGYSFPRKNFFQGRWITHAGWWPNRITRLFQKDLGHMTKAIVHEAVHVKGHVEALNVPIEHFTESHMSRLLIKIDKYSTLGAQEAYKAGKSATEWTAMLRACLTFLQGYFLRLGVLDGPQGLTLAVADAVNKYFKYAKLSQLCKQAKKESHFDETR